MRAIPVESAEPRRDAVGFVVVRVVAGAPSVRRYVHCVHRRRDGAIAALAYGTLRGAHVFADRLAAQQFAARLAQSRVFGALPHRIEPLTTAAEATG